MKLKDIGILLIIISIFILPIGFVGAGTQSSEALQTDFIAYSTSRADNPPFVNFTSPANDSEVKGSVMVTGTAFDDVNVTNVVLYINSTKHYPKDTGGVNYWSTWTYTLDTTKYPNAGLWIQANATDGVNNASYAFLFVKVNNTSPPPPNPKPSVTISSPLNNTAVNDTIKILGTATDDSMVHDVKIRINGSVYSATDTSGIGNFSTWELDFDTTILNNGFYSVTAIVYDIAQQGFNTIFINVQNPGVPPPNLPPFISISQTLNNTMVSGTIVIEGTASDDHGVNSVKIIINLITYDASDISGNGSWAVWNYTIDTTQYPDGWLNVFARADDGAKQSIKFIRILINNSAPINQRPVIWFVTPLNNSHIKGIMEVKGGARDDFKINTVKLIINSTEFTVTDTSGNSSWYSWERNFDTSTLSNGFYWLRAEAFDGELVGFALIYIFINNTVEKPDNILPFIEIIQPADNATVSDIFLIQGRAWDIDGIVNNVRLNIGGIYYNVTDDSGNGTWYEWSLAFDTKTLENGRYTLVASVFDISSFGEDSVEIYINNPLPNKCPHVKLISPDQQAVFNGTIIIYGISWDDNSVKSVKIKIDQNEFDAVDTSGNGTWYTWEYILNTSLFENNTYVLSVIASDGTCDEQVDFIITIKNEAAREIIPEDDGDQPVDDETDEIPSSDDISYEKPSSRFGVSTMTFIIVAVVLAISVFSTVVLGFETGKYKFLSLLVVPLYSRRKKDQVLENFTRGEIYGFIHAHPGTYFNHMKLALNLNNGTLAYHLSVLEEDNMVYSRNDRNLRRFYPTEGRLPSMDDGNGKVHTFVYLNATQNRIIKVIQSNPGLSQKEIAKILGKSNQVVNYNISSMAELGLVKLERDGKLTRCYPMDLYPVDDSAAEVDWND